MYMEDDDRFVKETGSIDKLTRDKLRGGPELPLKREKYYRTTGDEVCQVKGKHPSGYLDNITTESDDEFCQVYLMFSLSCFAVLSRCGRNIDISTFLKSSLELDTSYCDNDTRSASTQENESEIRRLEENTLLNSVLETGNEMVRDLSSWTLARQFKFYMSFNFGQNQHSLTISALSPCMEYVSQKMDDLLYASGIPQAIDRACKCLVKIDFFYPDIYHDEGYVHIKGTMSLLSGFNASSLLLVRPILPSLCLTDECLQNLLKNVEGVKDQSYKELKKMLEFRNAVKSQSGNELQNLPKEVETTRDQSDNMQNPLKEGKDQDIRELLGIPNKTLRNYPQKLSNFNIGICKLVNKFILDDPKDTLENNSSKSREIILDNLLADYTRKYGNLFKEARSRVGQVRKRTDLWHGNVLASRDKELFPEGSFAVNVQKLMKKDLNRLGAGGNGEIVEAFYQRKHLVIKETLLRELELSVVPKLEHKNLLPWFAIISGEKSERRPGQVSCYQIMQKMTEDLSASIRTIGGSIHDHILTLQQDNVPKAVVSQQAELMRRNTSGVFRNVLEGLKYLHEQGLVHRDIKASNILLKKPESCAHTSIFTCNCTPHWEVKVADFDSIGQINVLRERAAMRGKKKLKSGYRPFLKVSATGTSGYRAPEIFEEFTNSDLHDPEYFGPASDIWALGGVGIHIVMGFCTPRKQYQFGLMMLAHRGMLKGEERDDIISRTLGLHHIREGFPGEKWKDMINFVSRPLQIDWHQRPSAKELLQDPFIQRYNTTPGLDTVVNETATLDTANTSQASGNQHC